jgi:ribosomal protein S20
MSATHVMQPASGKTLTGGVHQKLAHSRTDAAKLLGISTNSLDRLTARGLLHPSRALRKPLYSTSELRRFLEETS